MKRYLGLLVLLLLNCYSDNLKVVADLPNSLKEVSGSETILNSDLLWMVNDAGNSSELFGLNKKGKIKSTVKVNAENIDWEDLTTDDEGNLYIGDFGNNKNQRRDLTILKVNNRDFLEGKKVEVELINFFYPEQNKFPPKKKKRYFDCEAFFYFHDYFYLFTKSRVDEKYGRTALYKIPAEPGNHEALKIETYNAPCNQLTCWTTSADISPDKSKVAILTPNALYVFSNFNEDKFFEGDMKEYKFDFITQKESVFFKDNNSVYITDELAYGIGGNLYEFKLKMEND